MIDRTFLIFALLSIILLSCKPSSNIETWSCFQRTEISSSLIGESESTVVIYDQVYAESKAKIILRDINLKKESVLQSTLTFDFQKEENVIEQTLKTVNWQVISDELGVYKDGNASRLFPDIGSTLRGTQELTENGVVKTTYDSGLVTECSAIN